MDTKKILVPTDFSVRSLEVVRRAIEQTGDQPLEIVLLHGANLSNSITDLLFFSKARLVKSLKTEEFREACDVLHNKYCNRIYSMYVDVITSNRNAYFRNYVEAAQIEEIYIPSKGILNFKYTKGFDTLPLLKKCKLPCTTINISILKEVHRRNEEPVLNVFFSGLK